MTQFREVQKERSMILQKEMVANHFREVEHAPETGKKIVHTLISGNLNELIRCFDNLLPIHPEVNALQNGMRKRTAKQILDAEKIGHSEDVCTYVKADIGMILEGNIGPHGNKLPPPDLLLLSYTGCYTYMKWFELLRQHFKAPVSMLHSPYVADGVVTAHMCDYIVKQLKEVVIPDLERISGEKFDIDRLRENLERSRQSEDDLVAVLQTAKQRPSPIDAFFGAVYYVGPIFGAFRGTEEGLTYYKMLREEIEKRAANKMGPITPEGELTEERYRLVLEGTPAWTDFRDFWKIFYESGAVVVASTYTKVGGVFDKGFRHDPDRPLESLAEYCFGCLANISLPNRTDLIADYIEEYSADGFLVNSTKSCNSYSAGQLLILREIEERCGTPGGFIETDLVDPRYYSGSNIRTRLESYFQMIDQTRIGAATA